MAAVQFSGIENVIKAFSSREVKAWSVWNGKQFLFSCVAANETDAAADLETLLNSLEKSASAVYTLKVYEDIARKGKTFEKINEKTPCHGSFNFKLVQYDGINSMPDWMREIKEENKLLKVQNEKLLDELSNQDDDDEPKDFLGRIGAMLEQDPNKLPMLVASVQSVLNMFTKQTTQTGQPVAIGQVKEQSEGFATMNGAFNPLGNVIEQLQKKDPQLLQHLTKLASMPDTEFKYLLSILDSMK